MFVAVIAALGVGVRGMAAWRAPAPPLADREALAQQLSAVDSLIASGGRRRGATQGTTGGAAAGTKAGANAARSARNGTVSTAGGAKAPPGLAPAAIDVDVAPASELDRLPGIGPALAGRIVADREANGPFGSVEALQRVRGVGPALAGRVAPYVTFSRSPRPIQTGVPPAGSVRRP